MLSLVEPYPFGPALVHGPSQLDLSVPFFAPFSYSKVKVYPFYPFPIPSTFLLCCLSLLFFTLSFYIYENTEMFVSIIVNFNAAE